MCNRVTGTFPLVFWFLMIAGTMQSLLVKIQSSNGETSQVVRRVGGRLTLNCKVFHKGVLQRNSSFNWTRNGAHVTQGIHEITVPAWSSLVINRITAADSGSYECFATTGNHRAHSSVLNVIVNSPPKLLTGEDYSTPSFNGLMTNDKVDFHCFAEGFPTPSVKWFKEGVELHDGDLERTITLNSNRGNGLDLQIHSVERRHAGNYTCWAGNKLGNISYYIHVVVKPRILKPQLKATVSRVIAVVGWSAVLKCGGHNLPESHIITYWKKNLSVVQGTPKYDEGVIFYDQKDPKASQKVDLYLKIFNVTKQDSGLYSCLASQEKGNVQDDIYLDVLQKDELPKPLVSIKDNQVNITVSEGSNAKLSCLVTHSTVYQTLNVWTQANTSSTNVTHPKANDSHTQTSSVVYSNETTSRIVLNLAITNVSFADRGWYLCRSEYFGSSVSRKVFLTVLPSNETSGSDTFSVRKVQTAKDLQRGNFHIVIIIVVGIVLAVVFALTAHQAWNRRKHNISYGGYSNPDEFNYDVFVSYSTKDLNWVKDQLIPVLEKYYFKYCIHSRDFEIGKAIIDNMADSVYGSRKVLAVVSRNYMSSKFCRGELDMAIYRNIEKEDSSLIVIRLDGINTKDFPKALRSKTFLDYFDNREREHWTERLIKHLYDKSGSQSSFYSKSSRSNSKESDSTTEIPS